MYTLTRSPSRKPTVAACCRTGTRANERLCGRSPGRDLPTTDGLELCYRDVDGDDYPGDTVVGSDDLQCSDPGTGGAATDCADDNAQVSPTMTEICNGRDDDCDGRVDEDPCAADAPGCGCASAGAGGITVPILVGLALVLRRRATG